MEKKKDENQEKSMMIPSYVKGVPEKVVRISTVMRPYTTPRRPLVRPKTRLRKGKVCTPFLL